MAKRVSKVIRDPEVVKYFTNLTPHDMQKTSFIMENFGEFGNKQKYNTYDLIEIPAGVFGKEGQKNKKPFITTIGLFIFNRVFIEEDLMDVIGYVNRPITKKVNSEINQRLSYALLEDRISLEALKKYHMMSQKFMPYCNIYSPSFSREMLMSATFIEKKKKELYPKYKEGIKNNDPKASIAFENELLEYAKELLKDDKAMDMYYSGAKGSFNNNFKNIFVMKGAVKDPDPTKGFNIVTSSYMTGIKKEDYAKTARALASGPYSRGVKTGIGGYWEKLFLRAFQHLVLDPDNKDCGTKKTIEITLTEKTAKLMMYSYMVEGNKLVELTSQNKDKYIGKTVKFRFSSMCESKNGICHACAGNLFNRIGITNVGVATPQVASKLKNISMKAFHDAQVNLSEIDIGRAFGIKS